MKKDKILVLCVDRDNDIGEKTKFQGPIIGKSKNLEVATALGLADPSDSDFNAIFEAIRVYEEVKKEHETEVATITGDKEVGIKSDKELNNQLNAVLSKFPADFVILVSDGSEDEYITPLIQSKVPILSVRRLIVKQSEQLESTYYKIKDFLTESLDNPKISRIIFGLPALIMILYVLFGSTGWRIILGILGVYFFIKGFQLEGYILSILEELRTSLTRKRFAFFTYIIAIAFASLAVYRGYETINLWISVGIFETISAFLSETIYFFYLTGISAWIGMSISRKETRINRILSVPIFGFAISLVIYNASQLILVPEYPILNFISSIVIGFFLIFLAIYIEQRS